MRVPGLMFGCAVLHISLSQLLHPLQKQEMLALKGLQLYHYIL